MNTMTQQRSKVEAEQLLSDYLTVCNRILSERTDSLPYRVAKRLSTAIWGDSNFRTIVYGDHPQDILGEFTICFDADARALSIRPPDGYEVAFTWKASRAYLEDVAYNRPLWYLEHPMQLDWRWLAERARDEVASNRKLLVAGAVGFTLGAAIAALGFSCYRRDS